MATTLETIRQLTIRARSEGVEQAERALGRMAQAQKQVATGADAVATSSDRQERSILASAAQFDKLLRSIDPAVKKMAEYEAGVRKIAREEALGKRSADEIARAYAALEQRYFGVEKAAEAASRAMRANALISPPSAPLPGGRAHVDANFATLGARSYQPRAEPDFSRLSSFQTIANDATKAGQAIKLTSGEVSNLGFQINDVATMLAMGQSPFMVMASQAGQITQILGPAGSLRGAAAAVGTAFMSMLNPITLAVLGLGAAATAATYFFTSSEDGADKATEAMERHRAVIDEIKNAYGAAAKSLEDYAAHSGRVLTSRAGFNEKEQRERLREASKTFLDSVGQERIVSGQWGRGYQFLANEEFRVAQDALRRFNDSVKAGNPDVLALNEAIAAIGESQPEVGRRLTALSTSLDEFVERARAAQGGARLSRIDPSTLDAASRGTFVPGAMEARDAYERLRLSGAEPVITDPNAPIPGSRAEALDAVQGDAREKADQQAEAYDRVVASAEKRLRQLQVETNAMSMGAEAASRLRYEIDLLEQATADGPISPEQEKRLKDLAASMAQAEAETRRLRESQQQLKEAQREAEQAGKQMGSALEKAFNGIVQGGDAAKRAIIELAMELAKSALFGEGAFAGLFQKGGFFRMGVGAAAPFGTANDNAVGGYAGLASGAVQRGILPAITPMGQGGIGGDARFPLGDATARLSGDGTVQSQVWNFFAGKGLKPHQIAGIMGNVGAESAFNPSAVGDAGKAFGLFQHHAARGGGPGLLGNPMASMELTWRELQTSESGVLQRLMASNDVRGATSAFAGFERPRGWSLGNPEASHNFVGRLAGAEAALQKFGSTTQATTGDLGVLGKGFGAFGNALGSMTAGGAQAGGGGGGFSGLISSLLGGVFSLFGFADGGVTNRPAIFGEAGPEAAVPLPDGRRIPVDLRHPPKSSAREPMQVSFGGPTITVQGNADERVLRQLRMEIADAQQQTLQVMRYQSENSWRTG